MLYIFSGYNRKAQPLFRGCNRQTQPSFCESNRIFTCNFAISFVKHLPILRFVLYPSTFHHPTNTHANKGRQPTSPTSLRKTPLFPPDCQKLSVSLQRTKT